MLGAATRQAQGRAGAHPHANAAGGPKRSRIDALDGLRGLAALIVLEHHALLASVPFLAGPYNGGPLPPRRSWEWFVTYTPLHVLWAGPEMVVVFFVLSGFVLSLPVARGGRLRLSSYYPARFLRLYPPVWAALAFAALLHVAVSHHALPAATWWLDAHSQPLSLHALRIDALLERHAGDWGFTSVLWSLRWEVIFSALLPLLLALAVLAGRARGSVPRIWTALLAALCFGALLEHDTASGVTAEYLLELPPFLLGLALAFEHERIARLATALRARTAGNAVRQLALGGACVCALSADWWLPAGVDTAPLVAAGASLTVVAALVVEPFGRLLRSRPMHWTGRRSYSLYLVHEPIVVALAFALHGRPPVLAFMVLATVLSLLAAAAFHRLVESPAHALARSWSALRTRGARPEAAPERAAVGPALP